jgi:hypothetical protein
MVLSNKLILLLFILCIAIIFLCICIQRKIPNSLIKKGIKYFNGGINSFNGGGESPGEKTARNAFNEFTKDHINPDGTNTRGEYISRHAHIKNKCGAEGLNPCHKPCINSKNRTLTTEGIDWLYRTVPIKGNRYVFTCLDFDGLNETNGVAFEYNGPHHYMDGGITTRHLKAFYNAGMNEITRFKLITEQNKNIIEQNKTNTIKKPLYKLFIIPYIFENPGDIENYVKSRLEDIGQLNPIYISDKKYKSKIDTQPYYEQFKYIEAYDIPHSKFKTNFWIQVEMTNIRAGPIVYTNILKELVKNKLEAEIIVYDNIKARLNLLYSKDDVENLFKGMFWMKHLAAETTTYSDYNNYKHDSYNTIINKQNEFIKSVDNSVAFNKQYFTMYSSLSQYLRIQFNNLSESDRKIFITLSKSDQTRMLESSSQRQQQYGPSRQRRGNPSHPSHPYSRQT